MNYSRSGSFRAAPGPYAGRAALRAGLYILLIVPLLLLAVLVRYAVLLTVLPMLVVNVALAELPFIGWLAAAVLGENGTVVDALALCMTFGSLAVYGLGGWFVWRLASRQVEARARQTLIPLAVVASLCVSMCVADYWLGAIDVVYANLIADLEYYGAVEDEEPWIPLSVLPALQQATHPEEFVFETDTGEQISLDPGALLAGIRLGGWLQALAFGLIPGALLGAAVGNGIRRTADLVGNPS